MELRVKAWGVFRPEDVPEHVRGEIAAALNQKFSPGEEVQLAYQYSVDLGDPEKDGESPVLRALALLADVGADVAVEGDPLELYRKFVLEFDELLVALWKARERFLRHFPLWARIAAAQTGNTPQE